MALKVSILPVTAYQQNCSILFCENSNKIALVDPGGDAEQILKVVEELGGTIEKIFLTHGHLDHVGAAKALSEELTVPIEGPHIGDKYWLDDLENYASMMNFPPSQTFTPDRWLEEGDTIQFGEQTLLVRHCPGHTPGHVIFYHSTTKLAMVGDVLFQGSIGRTDFPGGDHQQLIDSITQKLWPLGDDVQFIPGHGPLSTFGQERATNPFVADNRFG